MIPPQKDVSALLAADLSARLPGAVRDIVHSRGEVLLLVEPGRLVELPSFLKGERTWQFAFLAHL